MILDKICRKFQLVISNTLKTNNKDSIDSVIEVVKTYKQNSTNIILLCFRYESYFSII